MTAVADGSEAAGALLDPCGPAFAVAVIDCEMPVLDGPGALARVRAAGCGVPVLLVSGRSNPFAPGVLAPEPSVAFLRKPLDLSVLRQALASLLAGRP